jgi:hypothetical protein
MDVKVMMELPSEWIALRNSSDYPEDDLLFETTKGKEDKSAWINLRIYQFPKTYPVEQQIESTMKWQMKSLRAGDPGAIVTRYGQSKILTGQKVGFFEFYFIDSLGERNFFRKVVFSKRDKTGILEIYVKNDSTRYSNINGRIDKTFRY